MVGQGVFIYFLPGRREADILDWPSRISVKPVCSYERHKDFIRFRIAANSKEL